MIGFQVRSVHSILVSFILGSFHRSRWGSTLDFSLDTYSHSDYLVYGKPAAKSCPPKAKGNLSFRETDPGTRESLKDQWLALFCLRHAFILIPPLKVAESGI